MWDGYSLLFVQGNERSHGQDLGKIYLSYIIFNIILDTIFLSSIKIFWIVADTFLDCRICWQLFAEVQYNAIYVL